MEGGKCQDGADEIYVTLIQQLLKPEPIIMAGKKIFSNTQYYLFFYFNYRC